MKASISRSLALGLMVGLAGCTSVPVNEPPPPPAISKPVPPPKPVVPPAKPIKPKAQVPSYLPTPPPAPKPQIAVATAVPAARALLDKARLARRQGMLPEADALLERAMRLAPRDASLYLETAQVRLQQRQYPAAVQFAQKSLALLGNADAGTTRQERLDAWGVIAEARDAQGDRAGADKARHEMSVLE